MLLRLLFTFLTTLLCFTLPSRTLAVSEFSTSYESRYTFDARGGAKITHVITLTNNLAHIYPTVYNLAISSGALRDIQVSVNRHNLSPEIDRGTSVTTIHIPIQNASVGKDQATILEISYTTESFAEVIGNTYAITLPKTVKGNEATVFVREVEVPKRYGALSYSSLPAQTSEDQAGDTTLYRFVGGGDQSLTLHFGNEARYRLNLNYLLKNTTSSTATSELALPPDTGYQTVALDSLTPEPTEIVVDSDGNWLARYPLPPASKLEVNAVLDLTVSPTPVYFDPSTSRPLGSKSYWEQTSSIKRLATQLKSPHNLYDYLLHNLTYDYNQITSQKRLGASAALEAPTSAICTEFTDLFVATARAMGISSRAIIGYAVTSNSALRPQATSQDILHAYPEYLDPETQKWLAVDPTWGHTTGGSEYFSRLDFGHLAFVRWGEDPSYPLPAGSYRSPDTPRQIKLEVLSEPTPTPAPSYRILSADSEPVLVNTGKQALIQTTLEVEGHSVFVPYLPPYGRLPVNTPPKSFVPSRLLLLALLLPLALLLFFFLR